MGARISRALVSFSGLLASVACSSADSSGPRTVDLVQRLSPAELHDGSQVVVAHDHRATISHFEEALSGGVSVLGLDILAGDGQEHLNACRIPRSPWQIFEIYNQARVNLSATVASDSARYRIATTAQQLHSAKADGALALLLGSEGADHVVQWSAGVLRPSPSQVRAGVRARVNGAFYGGNFVGGGWRKSALWYPPVAPELNAVDKNGFPCPPGGGNGSSTLYWMNSQLTDQGEALIFEMNRQGVLIDLTHLATRNAGVGSMFSQVVDIGRPNRNPSTRSNAPVMSSHDYTIDLGTQHKAIAASGGDYGVVGYNFIAGPTNGFVDVAGLAAAMKTLADYLGPDGADHIALGADYYDGQYPFAPASIADLRSLTQALSSVGFSDQELRKILGENMLTLYQRVLDPTRGYSGGLARFYTCTNASTTAECLAVRAHSGQGDFNHRPVTCLNATPGAVNLQLTYQNGVWNSWSPASTLVPCIDGSLLAVSWDDGAPNGEFAMCGDTSQSAVCLAAAANGGSGVVGTRAVNCRSPLGSGVIGLHVPFSGGKWKYYNLAIQLNDCSPTSTLVSRWGPGATGTAQVQLCDDRGSDATDPNANPVCVAAAAGAGSGTGSVRALSCYNSSPTKAGHGSVGLQLRYVDGRWVYYGVNGVLYPCVHGSVLVARQN